MGYGRAGGPRKHSAALFPAKQDPSDAPANDARGAAPRPRGEPARHRLAPPAKVALGRGARRTARLTAANDPDLNVIYCRLGELVIPTVTAFARHLKGIHGPKVSFDRSPGYWLVRAFGLPLARYRVFATGEGLEFQQAPLSKRQWQEVRTWYQARGERAPRHRR
jgi:hypothetical protein